MVEDAEGGEVVRGDGRAGVVVQALVALWEVLGAAVLMRVR